MSTTNLNRRKLLLLFFEEGDDEAILKLCKEVMDNYFLVYATFGLLKDCGFDVEDIKNISIANDCVTLVTYNKKMAKKVSAFDGHPCTTFKKKADMPFGVTSIKISREDNVVQLKCI